ncbi:MAG: 4Fe-4S dicluster domain-containing protein [Thermoleophilia bacterium]|nr:4Fe-4S dicluster domain-containing protein [Thermoleophilia bacterium]
MSTVLDPALKERVARDEEFNAQACMNCGVCTAVCPMGIECLPRRLFRYVLLGMRQELLGELESVYSCLLCKMCEVNCPAGVRIADNVRLLRGFINREVFGL